MNPFFDQFKDSAWEPPRFPHLSDSDWLEQFNKAGVQEKTNLANGWLWLFNLELDKAADNDGIRYQMGVSLDASYKWLREALPLTSKKMFEGNYCDGSVNSMLKHTSSLPELINTKYEQVLEALWFSKGGERVTAVFAMEEMIANLRRTAYQLPDLKNLVQNLAWATVAENPENLALRGGAAAISIEYGLCNLVPPGDTVTENRAWHNVAKITTFAGSDPRHAFGLNNFQVIRNSHPAVAAKNLPTLIRLVRNDTGKSSPYLRKSSLTSVFDVEVERLTDYDILRAWIPAKESLWNTYEALDMPYEEACAEVAKELNAELRNKPELPHGLTIDI